MARPDLENAIANHTDQMHATPLQDKTLKRRVVDVDTVNDSRPMFETVPSLVDG
jgi:hypothetical protein